jgi:hypothetical protein
MRQVKRAGKLFDVARLARSVRPKPMIDGDGK